MKKNLFFLLVAILLGGVFTACGDDKNKPESPAKEKKLSISVDKKEVGVGDDVTFTVKFEEKDLTKEAKISIDGKEIEGNVYKTEKEGKIKVVASAKGYVNSDELSVNVIAKEVVNPTVEPKYVLKADKTKAKPNEVVTFTVLDNGVDVTDQFRFVVNDQKLPGNTYVIKQSDNGFVSARAINKKDEKLVIGVTDVYIDKGEVNDKNFTTYANEQAERVLESLRLEISGIPDERKAGLFKITRAGKEYQCTRWELTFVPDMPRQNERVSVIFYVPVKTEGGKTIFQSPKDVEKVFLDRVHADLNDKNKNRLPLGNSSYDEMQSFDMTFSEITDVEKDKFSNVKVKAKMSFVGRFTKMLAKVSFGDHTTVHHPNLFINWTDTEFDLIVSNFAGTGENHIDIPYFKN